MRTIVMATAGLLSGCGVPPMGHLSPSIEVVFPADLSEIEAVEDAEGNLSWPLTIVVDVDNFSLVAPDAEAELSAQEGHWHVMCGIETCLNYRRQLGGRDNGGRGRRSLRGQAGKHFDAGCHVGEA